MKTIKQLAQTVLDAQNASNLSGVVNSFSVAISQLWEISRTEGWESTEKINHHPISILFASKIASLTYCDSPAEFHQAYEWVKRIVEQEG